MTGDEYRKQGTSWTIAVQRVHMLAMPAEEW